MVTILSPTRNLVEGYKTVYLCHLDSYTVTVCNGYLVSSHVVTVQLPTRCLKFDCLRQESNFLASTRSVTAVCVRVGLRITIMQSHTHTMQQTRMHKAVTRRVEAKKDSKSYSLVEGTWSIVDRFLHRPHGSGYLITYVSRVVTVQ